MSVLLGLGDVQLLQTAIGQHFGEHVGHGLGPKGDRQGELLLVAGHRHERHARRLRSAVELGKRLLEEGACELAGTVGTKVEEQADVAVAHPVLVARADHRRSHELVGLAALVSGGHGGLRPARLLAPTVDERVVGQLDAFPSGVAVHGVVAPSDGAVATYTHGLHVLLDLGQKTR